jgi:CRISPR-associated protein (TIGR02584 family)
MPESTRPRETVLLALAGMSPAVVTETVWALAREKEPVLPDRVIVVTTVAGKEKLENALLAAGRPGGPSPWRQLRETLGAGGRELLLDPVRVITAPDPAAGARVPLEDIRTPEANEAAADFLLETVRGLVENPDVHLIASLAGGRKTMGALLYACFTLAARETDRLTHVLVSAPYETLPGFLHPGQPGGPVEDREGRPHDPAEARIELADVPFVPLRNLFLRELGQPAGSFLHLVERCREQVRRAAGAELRITVHTARTRAEIDGLALDTSPREHIVLLFLASRLKRGEAPFPSYAEAVPPLNAFLGELRSTAREENPADWRHGDALTSKFDADAQDLRRALSSLRGKLRRFGPPGIQLAAALPEHGRFSLEAEPSLVFLR